MLDRIEGYPVTAEPEGRSVQCSSQDGRFGANMPDITATVAVAKFGDIVIYQRQDCRAGGELPF